MKRIYSIALTTFLTINTIQAQVNDSITLRVIFNEILKNGKCYSDLDYLSNKIGGRISGSPQAAAAVEWTKQTMLKIKPDTVYLQEVMVPHWERGEKEYAKILNSKSIDSKEVPICALGGSVATPTGGIVANVVEVRNFEDLAKLGRKGVEGKIVFFNRPMDPTIISTFESYSKAVGLRWGGASEAARYGAVGSIVRSVTLSQDDYPHTGVMGYNDSLPKIPACAISTNGANLLSKLLKTDSTLKFHFTMSCQMLPDVKSYNVIGEIKGAEHPEEIIVVGGHLDAWDNGSGAHDDGAGVVQAIEVLRAMKALGIKPKRTIRAVAFMNEENGGRGGKKYAELAKQNNEKHIAAIESDAGGFTPRGFGIEGTSAIIKTIQAWKPLLEIYGLHDITAGGGGSDIEPLKEQNVTLIGFVPDSQRYFDYHHTAIDTFDKVNKRELELGAASMAALIYLISVYGF